MREFLLEDLKDLFLKLFLESYAYRVHRVHEWIGARQIRNSPNTPKGYRFLVYIFLISEMFMFLYLLSRKERHG